MSYNVKDNRIQNIFTIDTEEWFHANYQNGLFDNRLNNVSTVEKNVDTLLSLFDNAKEQKATFFILGTVAEQYPTLVKKISSMGHEIASHGYGHQLVYNQTSEEFREDIRKSKILLENIIGESIIGYRAPSWSITERSLWALDILEEEGFLYTSSIFPTKNFLYGIPYAPRFAHAKNAIYNKENLSLMQIPPSTAMLMKQNIPFSGGAYFRLLPYCIIKRFANYINNVERQPVIFYLHPREIDMDQPRLQLGVKDRLIHYYGIKGCKRKLINVLNNYNFITMKELYESM